MKTQINNVEEELRTEFKDSLARLENAVVDIRADLLVASSSGGGGGGEGKVLGTNAQRKMLHQVDQIQSQIEAIWEYLANTSAKIVDLESKVDL